MSCQCSIFISPDYTLLVFWRFQEDINGRLAWNGFKVQILTVDLYYFCWGPLRSSRPEVFYKKDVFENFAKLTGKNF